MDKLPKILGIALVELIEEQNVMQWNIHSNGNTVNVTMKFAMPGHVGAQSPISQSQVNSMRNKSPAQLRRNNSRAMAWSESTPQTNFNDCKHSFVPEYNSENVQVRDNSRPNIEISACAPCYVPESVSKPGQVIVGSSNNVEDNSKSELETPGHTDSLADIINTVVDSHANKWNSKCIIEADHSESFTKIIIDHRGVVKHTTVRGLTKDGTIVNFETNKHSDFFHVLEKDEENEEYNDVMNVINMFSDCRNNFYNVWSNETKQMYKHWDHYLNTKT
jgi:hypothetical protein